ncbi:MAG: 2Fe-2S iron-sulfur cluster-binding protein [Crocinitomicaceae bacterium]
MALFKFLKKKDTKIPRGFHEITIKQVIRLTELSVQIVLDIPEDLKQTFHFVPGQYINFIVNTQGEDHRRSYSICSGSNEDLSIAVKEMDKGKVSTWFNREAQAGKVILCSAPEGQFILKDEHKKVIGFSGGSGITPILSIAKKIQETGREMELFYGNYDLKAMIFRDEIDALSQVKPHYIFSDESTGDYKKGLMDAEMVAALIKENIDILHADAFFLCGPIGMIKAAEAQLELFGVPKSKIKKELFSAPDTGKDAVTTGDSKEMSSQVTVILEGETIHLDYKPKGKSIIDSLNQKGYDPPYSCRGGVCSTCKSKILEGSATMKINYSLTDEEIAEGYVLSCQAVPTSEKLTITFDV